MGLTRIRAEQISNIDYKQAVRAVSVADVNLTGGAPAVLDGVSLATGNRILVAGQTNKAQNGIYFVQTLGAGENGTWVRASDANETGEIEPGMVVMVTEGTTYADTPWKLITNGAIVIGVTELTFQQFSANVTPGGSNTQIQFNSSNIFAGSANLTWDGSELYVGGGANIAGNVTLGDIAGNLVPAANVTYDLGSAANRWNDLYLAGNSIYLGNIALTETGNTTLAISHADGITPGNITANVGVFTTLYGNGAAITGVAGDRGTDSNDWNSIIEMGAYKVNRDSWSGTTGTPTDSTVFVGILQVLTSSDATTQIFYPGTIGNNANDVRIQWNRSLWNGAWTTWYKIINDRQVVDAGSY